MSFIKIIITLIILNATLNAKVIVDINKNNKMIYIVNKEENFEIIAPLNSITVEKVSTRFETSFYMYISGIRKYINIDENTFNEIKYELIKSKL